MIHHAFLHNVMQKTSPAQSLHTVLLRALDDRMADYIAVSQALDALGWHSRHTYCCLYLQLSDMDQKNLTANSVCAYLENILTGCSAFPHGGGIVAFFNLTLSDFSMTDLMERMVHFVEDSSLNAGFFALHERPHESTPPVYPGKNRPAVRHAKIPGQADASVQRYLV